MNHGSSESRPLVVAHRGSSDLLAEHTLAAYLRAIDEGADALECDVRLTRDGHLVCVHDRRVERTSNGRGVVSEFSLAELNAFDFGSWRPDLPASADELILDRPTVAEPPLLDANSRVLTFARLLRTVLEAPRPIKLLVETKHPTRYGGLVEQTLVSELRQAGLADPATPAEARVTVMSFSRMAVRRVRDHAPRVPTVLLMEAVPVWLRDGSLPTGVRIAGPGIDVVRAHPRYVERVHAAGNKVYVWTVNATADIDLVVNLRVDGIITDRPTAVLSRLSEVA